MLSGLKFCAGVGLLIGLGAIIVVVGGPIISGELLENGLSAVHWRGLSNAALITIAAIGAATFAAFVEEQSSTGSDEEQRNL